MAHCRHGILPKKYYALSSKELIKVGQKGFECLLFRLDK